HMMIRKRGGRPRHNLSQYINVLPKTSPKDKSRQCVCKACAEILKEEAQTITNRRERIKKHLSECEYFWNKHGREVAEEILKSCDSNTTTSNLSLNSTLTISNSDSSNKTQIKKFKQSGLSKYAVRNLTKAEIPVFYNLLIRMTVANSWAFQWINDPTTLALFN
ncbi:2821_t:CDS:2, partial [Dentiscutata heterogama]